MCPETIWQEFTEKLRRNEFTEADCKPVNGICFGIFVADPEWSSFREDILNASMPSWEHGEDKLIFKINEGKPQEVRFDFVIEDTRWFLYFVDAFTIPIKSIPHLPFNDFPSLNPSREAFGRAEEIIHFKLKAYQKLLKVSGKAEALTLFEDGFSKLVGSSAWMPYFSTHKALVVLIAWNENRLHSEDTVIEEFSESKCVLLYRNHIWFKMYRVNTQFRKMIDFAEYTELFEHTWRDRAKCVGWDVTFNYDGDNTRVTFLLPSQNA